MKTKNIMKMKTLKTCRRTRFDERKSRLFAKGRKTAIHAIAFVMLSAVFLASCSSDDPEGKWDPMIWKTEVPVQATNGVYTVSATGSEITFVCRNYSSPWIENAVSAGEYHYPPREANDYHTITADWFKAEIKGNQLKVTFEDNETAKERPLELTVTAGDIFHTFKFIQYAN